MNVVVALGNDRRPRKKPMNTDANEKDLDEQNIRVHFALVMSIVSPSHQMKSAAKADARDCAWLFGYEIRGGS